MPAPAPAVPAPAPAVPAPAPDKKVSEIRVSNGLVDNMTVSSDPFLPGVDYATGNQSMGSITFMIKAMSDTRIKLAAMVKGSDIEFPVAVSSVFTTNKPDIEDGKPVKLNPSYNITWVGIKETFPVLKGTHNITIFFRGSRFQLYRVKLSKGDATFLPEAYMRPT